MTKVVTVNLCTVPLEKDPWMDDKTLLTVTWLEFPVLRRWCHKDETEFRARVSNSEGPRRDFEQRTDNTHTHMHTRRADWLLLSHWSSADAHGHTYREGTWEKSVNECPVRTGHINQASQSHNTVLRSVSTLSGIQMYPLTQSLFLTSSKLMWFLQKD